MNDLIQRIVNAIFRQEGMPADYVNPGNLRDCPWFPITHMPIAYMSKPPKLGPVRSYPDGTPVIVADGYWKPRTRAEGIAGAAHVVALHIAEGNTLAQLIAIWAPPRGNNPTAAYTANVKEWAGIPDENQPLWNYLG